MDRLCTIEETAALLTLSPWTVRKWIADSKIPVVRLGRRIAIEQDTIRQLIEQAKGYAEAAKQ